MKILVVNCGSSSIKYQLFQMPEHRVLARGLVERIGEPESCLLRESNGNTLRTPIAVADHEAGIALILRTLTEGPSRALGQINEIAAVGHRVVHGADAFTGSVLIDEEVLATIERVADLAPLHNPPNLVGIRATRHALPDIPQIACFDTAFHTTLPQVAYLYALPYELYEKYGVRRYGFHGTSHRYVASRAAEILGKPPAAFNCITCHLGNGCSMAAVRGGKSVDTSMGLTPLEGLVMGTRTGDLDPAILLFLGSKGYSIEVLNDLCNRQSGLIGVSGLSNDVRTLCDMAAAGNERARLAIDIFCYRVKKYIGAYTAVLGTLDVLVFTGGIGENAAAVRAGCCENLGQLGIEIDLQRNEATIGREVAIQSSASRVTVLVIPTDEEGVIAADTYALVQQQTCWSATE